MSAGRGGDGRVDRQRLGWMVCRLRKAAGLTQYELAAKVGLTRSSIANIETGRQTVTLDSLDSLAAELGTTVSAFLAEDGDRQSASTTLLARVAGQQRALTRTLAELAALVAELAEQSECMEQLLAEPFTLPPTSAAPSFDEAAP